MAGGVRQNNMCSLAYCHAAPETITKVKRAYEQAKTTSCSYEHRGDLACKTTLRGDWHARLCALVSTISGTCKLWQPKKPETWRGNIHRMLGIHAFFSTAAQRRCHMRSEVTGTNSPMFLPAPSILLKSCHWRALFVTGGHYLFEICRFHNRRISFQKGFQWARHEVTVMLHLLCSDHALQACINC